MRENFPHKKAGDTISAHHLNMLSDVARRTGTPIPSPYGYRSGQASANLAPFNQRLFKITTITNAPVYGAKPWYYDTDDSTWKKDDEVQEIDIDASAIEATFILDDVVEAYYDPQRDAYIPILSGDSAPGAIKEGFLNNTLNAAKTSPGYTQATMSVYASSGSTWADTETNITVTNRNPWWGLPINSYCIAVRTEGGEWRPLHIPELRLSKLTSDQLKGTSGNQDLYKNNELAGAYDKGTEERQGDDQVIYSYNRFSDLDNNAWAIDLYFMDGWEKIAAECNATTTSDTTVTDGTTTTGSTTTANTTTTDADCGSCVWEWDGTKWNSVSGCSVQISANCNCPYPPDSFTPSFIGQLYSPACIELACGDCDYEAIQSGSTLIWSRTTNRCSVNCSCPIAAATINGVSPDFLGQLQSFPCSDLVSSQSSISSSSSSSSTSSSQSAGGSTTTPPPTTTIPPGTS